LKICQLLNYSEIRGHPSPFRDLGLFFTDCARRTHGQQPDLLLEQADLLEVCAVMVVSIELGQLSAIPNMAREDPDAREVRVQLGAEDDDSLLRQSLQSQSCVLSGRLACLWWVLGCCRRCVPLLCIP
jgi:hypothetical protein